jgi:hypothetical protein
MQNHCEVIDFAIPTIYAGACLHHARSTLAAR